MRTLSHLRPYLIPTYFTLGGVAGGLLVLGGLAEGLHLAELAAAPRVRDALAVPLLLISGAILTADLTHPLRFWRLLVTFRPSSPVSWGSWILTFAGAVAAAELLDLGGRAVHALACVTGAALAGYTGVLLAASSRLRWYATPLFGGVFLATGLTSAAALVLAVAGGGGRRAVFVAALGALAAGLLRAHLDALDVEVRAGRLEPALPPAARDWLAHGTLAAVFAAALLPLAATGTGWAVLAALCVLAADACVRFAAFWLEEGPAAPPPAPISPPAERPARG